MEADHHIGGEHGPGWKGWLRALWHDLLRDPITRRRAWIVVAGLLVCGYAVGVFGYVLATPEIGVRCAFTRIVNHFYPEFLYPRDQKPLGEGDTLVKVGGQPVENWSQLLRKMLLLRTEKPETVEGLTVQGLRAGRVPEKHTFVLLDGHRLVRVVYRKPDESGTRTAWCRLGLSPIQTLIPSILWFFLKMGLFAVGAIVLWKRPEDRSAEQFFWLCIVSFGAYMGGYHWSRIVTQPVLILVFMTCAVMLPAVTLHFYLVFPRAKGFLLRNPRTVLPAVYGPAMIFLLLLLHGYLYANLLEEGGGGPFAGIQNSGGSAGNEGVLALMLLEIYAYFAIAALWYLMSVACLVHSFRTAATPIERNQVKWILVGVAAALGPIGYSLYLAFWDQVRFGGGGATWPMFTASAFVTLAYTISITRYRLMQLDQIISSGAVYFLFSRGAGLFYYGVVFVGLFLVGSNVGESASWGQGLAVAGTALVLVVALDLVRGRFLRALDRHFRREKHQLDHTLQRMSQAIEQLVDPPALARRLLQTTAEMLSAPAGAVYLRQGVPPLYCLTDAIGPPPALTELSSGCPLVEALLRRSQIADSRMQAANSPFGIMPSAMSHSIDVPALRQLHLLKGTVAQALTHEGQMLGLLLLGPRQDSAYTREDMQLLAAFAQITVLALVSAEGYRTIEGLNRDLKTKVEKIAEQQRRILALQSQLSRRSEVGSQKPEVKDPIGPIGPTGPISPMGPMSPTAPDSDGIIGSSPQVQHLLSLVKRVAPSEATVLLRGESGTGKGVLARVLHDHSPRAGKPFVKVHCAALSAGLLESELFGHVKGAFTSAIRDKVGRFESANGGTLFFDEIGDISLEVQTKLLRVLEEMTFERVGSSESMQVDVRIIAATHRNLEKMIEEGRFREDLFFRLSVLPITVPPLRERVEDIPELVAHFLRLYGQRVGKPVTMDDDALAVLKGFAWPGNVRQLENVVERAVIIAEGATITVDELPDDVKEPLRTADRGLRIGEESVDGDGSPLSDDVQSAIRDPQSTPIGLPELASVIQAERAERERREREQLVRALAAAGGNKAVAARALGLARSTLVSRLKKFGLS
jgi:transcriptional regulator with GAF, ATPase, and Fis domain